MHEHGPGSVESGYFTEADLPRLVELSPDPAHGGVTRESSWAEAEVGLGLEKRGDVQGLVRSPHEGAEFVDASGQWWDVKAFRSVNPRNGRPIFSAEVAVGKIEGELTAHNNVMLDRRHLTAQDQQRLSEALQNSGTDLTRILWWP